MLRVQRRTGGVHHDVAGAVRGAERHLPREWVDLLAGSLQSLARGINSELSGVAHRGGPAVIMRGQKSPNSRSTKPVMSRPSARKSQFVSAMATRSMEGNCAP